MAAKNSFEEMRAKLNESVLDDENLICKVTADKYPIVITIQPQAGMDAQMTMLEGDGAKPSEDARILFIFSLDGLRIQQKGNITLEDATFNKIKNLCKKMYVRYLEEYFRDRSPADGRLVALEDGGDTAEDAAAEYDEDGSEEMAEAFAVDAESNDFFGENQDADE